MRHYWDLFSNFRFLWVVQNYLCIQSMVQKAGAVLRWTDPTANQSRGAFFPVANQMPVDSAHAKLTAAETAI